ncbi:HpcH/HpaI aldolase family protein [Cupriavidus plantarum]|uniref:HpcH/HpaI aldolase family protein n=1 Tax=Cupriavidus plantarum TaxID=942865 RepID=UPI000E226AB8|nr:aldolase/citrate lyase family protein [Cupriavidus plantarum]REF01970.1 4-hydroxy-2-oxoheptanedioate aldolase [Cupriavidus plantarum]RLK45183.1 4-hydroxy-2-oxoheptanedioate aldolase [Cupriavidus plantarum]CAG2129035.1 4-hydroxy-2-oxo-heptane-1,7-dioate aldolase [Cupriavidus plantarum]SMR66375.1 4-hydroxy-2-oxoheptanedioate aldolase [Cupriavidus plantarum]
MTIQHPIDNRLPAMLRSGNPLRGIFSALPSPAIVEMCGYAGFDFVIIDNEHGAADLETTEHMLRAARASGIVPVVRCFIEDIPRVLDMGASAVQIPMVETADDARELVRRVRYPGKGQRGSAFSGRAAGYGAFPGASHTSRSNEGIALIAMIESPEGVANAEAIAAVEGIDAVFVGPNDLSHAMGFGSDWKRPEVAAAIEQALRAVDRAGKCPGVLALTAEDEQRYRPMGARYFATVATSLITTAFRQAATAGRAGGELSY